MESASTRPVASLARLKELGLDPATFGSCSATDGTRGWRGTMERVTNVGCKYHGECKWANEPVPDKSENGEVVLRPRPRFLKTRLIKPRMDGSGKDAIRENYCSCAQWHADLKRRHNTNGQIAEVCGGEGDTVLLLGSKLEGAVYKPSFSKTTIPVFPDPTDDPEMIVDVYSSASRKSSAQDEEAELKRQRDRRMAGAKVGENTPTAKSQGEGTVDDLKSSLGAGGKKGA